MTSTPEISPTGDLTFRPAANAFGTATITVRLDDNGDTSNGGANQSTTLTFDIIITNVNDVPSFTKGADQTVLEDAGAQTVAGWATAINAGPNEGTQTLTFSAGPVCVPARERARIAWTASPCARSA